MFSLAGVCQASADQTINIDLNNFLPDTTVIWPIQTFDGFVAGDVITVNVSNALGRIEGYINNGVGSSISFSQDTYQITNLTDPSPFTPAGNMTSINNSTDKPIGTAIAVVTLGQNPLLDLTIPAEATYAAFSSNPARSLGLVGFWDGTIFKLLNFLGSNGSRAYASNTLRLDTQGTTTEKNNVVSCTPGKYTFLNGGSTAETAKIQSFVYTLLINGKAVSTLSSDNFKSVASHMFPAIAGNLAGTATLEGATWDLKGMSNYSAQCQVYATQSGGNIQSVTSGTYDSVALAAQAEEAAKAQKVKDMIADWNATNDALIKKYRDQRLAGKP